MLKNAQIVIDQFNAKGFTFDAKEVGEGDVILKFPYNGMVATLLFSGDDGKYLTVFFQLDSAPQGKEVDVIVACNTMNSMFKWLKFYLDKNNNIIAQDDAILDSDSAFDETMELMLRAFSIIKDVKPTLMRTLYA